MLQFLNCLSITGRLHQLHMAAQFGKQPFCSREMDPATQEKWKAAYHEHHS
jgi:hypothetical protein